ncbi:aldose 1-epimerase family protein [Verrucomicrobia bacterium]|nr:aldose 1-epimerase family protein [Verrucomicrobiota bacterium]
MKNKSLILCFLYLVSGIQSLVMAQDKATPSVIQIENGQLRVKVKLFGAELNSIYSKKNHLEYLWQAKTEAWDRQAPILFPIAGKLTPEEFLIDGKPTTIRSHGFARDYPFELMEQSKTRVMLQQRDNADTRAMFPRAYLLQVVYELTGNKLSIGYVVTNPVKKNLPFVLGSHPGFNCPLEPSLKFSDYYLQFDQKESATRMIAKSGMITETQPNFTKNQSRMDLRPDGPEGAIFLRGLKSKTVTLKSDKGKREVSVQINNFPLIGFWTRNPEAGFFCIEPWMDPRAPKYFQGEFSERPGVMNLPPGKSWASDLAITIK